MSLTVHLALVFHVFIAVAIMVMPCGRRICGHGSLWPSWYRSQEFQQFCVIWQQASIPWQSVNSTAWHQNLRVMEYR